MIFVATYFLIGIGVAAFVYRQRHHAREKEIGDWMAMVGSVSFFFGASLLLLLLLWPLWLLLLLIPRSAFAETPTSAPAPPPESVVGRQGTVVAELRPTGRVAIDGVWRDARAVRGTIDRGAVVRVVASGIGGELLVEEQEITSLSLIK